MNAWKSSLMTWLSFIRMRWPIWSRSWPAWKKRWLTSPTKGPGTFRYRLTWDAYVIGPTTSSTHIHTERYNSVWINCTCPLTISKVYSNYTNLRWHATSAALATKSLDWNCEKYPQRVFWIWLSGDEKDKWHEKNNNHLYPRRKWIRQNLLKLANFEMCGSQTSRIPQSACQVWETLN